MCCYCGCLVDKYSSKKKRIIFVEKGEDDVSRKSVQTQCNRPSQVLYDIERLIVESIRADLKEYRGDVGGRKNDLSLRLQWFRAREYDK